MVTAAMQFTEDSFGKYVDCKLPLEEWLRVHDEVQRNETFRARLREASKRLALTEDGRRLLEIHEAMREYVTRFKSVLGESHGNAGPDS
jgi:hypothetical protein